MFGPSEWCAVTVGHRDQRAGRAAAWLEAASVWLSELSFAFAGVPCHIDVDLPNCSPLDPHRGPMPMNRSGTVSLCLGAIVSLALAADRITATVGAGEIQLDGR